MEIMWWGSFSYPLKMGPWRAVERRRGKLPPAFLCFPLSRPSKFTPNRLIICFNNLKQWATTSLVKNPPPPHALILPHPSRHHPLVLLSLPLARGKVEDKYLLPPLPRLLLPLSPFRRSLKRRTSLSILTRRSARGPSRQCD